MYDMMIGIVQLNAFSCANNKEQTRWNNESESETKQEENEWTVEIMDCTG